MKNKNLIININNPSKSKFDFKVKEYILHIFKIKKIKWGLFDFNFVDNKTIIEINKKYLKRKSATDVITFNLGDKENIIGDVYISTEQAQKNAKTFKNYYNNEIKLLLVHSILHLLDYRDYNKEEKAIMRKEEKRILTLLDKKNVKHQFKLRSLIKSFKHALHGLGFIIYSQRNMKIHLFVGIFVLCMGFLFKISYLEWMLLILSISSVLITEAINTAIEISVDLTTKKRKYRAMLSKDIAAGAVLISSICALFIGFIIFFNRFLIFLGGLI